ncbi:hypothetical protein K0028_14745 [Curtobacterium flaccumfaciens pv. flaccumfaciens]|uniref:hypothetical protein n=1 Tax=Curtobacterium flaccumfaciens TaxID=2035 RepID=UPI00217E164A|nr:hypothetical protein [Curtobacterium flaccumfaciens]MCS6556396.1 hypothetical protein [Curtobacterium flaccumfaciens]QYI96910.1 hypothetical protein K0028_14745 [Curtobacterium flaccumfaciens pv. flaccumfaciens]
MEGDSVPENASQDDVLTSGTEAMRRLLRGQTPEEELRSTAELKGWLDAIPVLVERAEKLAQIHSSRRSVMSVDDEHSNPIQFSHMVHFCMLVAIDDLQALRQLMHPDGADVVSVPIFAMYPLLRGVIEASAQAIWLLEGADRAERLTRLVRARSTELAYEQDLAREIAKSLPAGRERQEMEKQIKKDRRRRRSYIIDVIEQNGLDRGACDVTMPGYGPLVELAGPHVGINGNLVRSVWQFVSGLTHPSTARALTASTLIEVAPARGNIRSARVEADIGQVTVVFPLAIRLYRVADSLRRTRMVQAPGDD